MTIHHALLSPHTLATVASLAGAALLTTMTGWFVDRLLRARGATATIRHAVLVSVLLVLIGLPALVMSLQCRGYGWSLTWQQAGPPSSPALPNSPHRETTLLPLSEPETTWNSDRVNTEPVAAPSADVAWIQALATPMEGIAVDVSIPTESTANTRAAAVESPSPVLGPTLQPHIESKANPIDLAGVGQIVGTLLASLWPIGSLKIGRAHV